MLPRNILLACSGIVGMLAMPAHADQAYPSQPIRIIVPIAAGGSTDVLARSVAQELGKTLGATVVVENKPGAAGAIGAQAVARAAPDGYTLLLTSPDPITVLPNYKSNLHYDAAADFAPIQLIAEINYVFATRTDFPAQDLAAFLKMAQQSPGKYTFSSAGTGTNTQLVTEMLRQRLGVDMVHVPYQGSGPALIAVASGEVDVQATSMPSMKALYDAGRLKALAVTSEQRFKALPAVPTMQESGVNDFVLSAWFGVFAPAGTPAPIQEKLDNALGKVMSSPEIRTRLDSLSMTARPMSLAAFGAYLDTERQRWKTVIDIVGLKD
ncbi:Bug family tripartite tricarboxylate transporter substrate binding protein [Bordetella bronchiseptica]|uniref:Bug family tripartite tricarboxylate transporter substrate binding protein n=1 Tax=Bordetella bronchiseptica TaxID=518 RepID=UPI0009B88C6B|nr:tripartite tricarboxylate transporter substrate binding protein [Bordetella bronchiseptica]